MNHNKLEIILIEHTTTKVESGSLVKYGEPRSILPLITVAKRLNVDAEALLRALRSVS